MAKTDTDRLRELIEQCPPAGSRFRHYKGGEYVVVGAAILEATLEPVVLYSPVEGDGSGICWVRLLSVWGSWVQVGEEQIRRFQRID
jgi:hypothetical protein